jgi:hypothetical protein
MERASAHVQRAAQKAGEHGTDGVAREASRLSVGMVPVR